jgi:hypothetical protein
VTQGQLRVTARQLKQWCRLTTTSALESTSHTSREYALQPSSVRTSHTSPPAGRRHGRTALTRPVSVLVCTRLSQSTTRFVPMSATMCLLAAAAIFAFSGDDKGCHSFVSSSTSHATTPAALSQPVGPWGGAGPDAALTAAGLLDADGDDGCCEDDILLPMRVVSCATNLACRCGVERVCAWVCVWGVWGGVGWGVGWGGVHGCGGMK